MRNLLRIVPLLLLGIAAGCTIYSINPFCTKGRMVELKTVSGYWKLNVSAGDDVSKNDITPWKITDNTLITYDKNSKRSDFNIAFFKLKDQLFADITATLSQNNDYWNITVLPMHVLVKVEIDGDTLTFIPLNMEWFSKPDNEKVKALKSVAYDGNDKTRIYTNTPEEWERFLESNMDIPELFNQKQKFVLQKIAAAGTSEKS